MVNMRCHIPVRSFLCCLVITNHHCGRWCFGAWLCTLPKIAPADNCIGSGMRFPKQNQEKPYPLYRVNPYSPFGGAKEKFWEWPRRGHPPLRKWTMSNANTLVFALALGLSAAAFAWPAMAQQPAQQSARDAAIHR